MGSGYQIAIRDCELVIDPGHVRELMEESPCLVDVCALGFEALGRIETLVGSWIVKEGGAENHHGLAGGVEVNFRNTAGVAGFSLAERVAVDGDTLCVTLGIPLRDVVEYCAHFGLDGSVAVKILSP